MLSGLQLVNMPGCFYHYYNFPIVFFGINPSHVCPQVTLIRLIANKTTKLSSKTTRGLVSSLPTGWPTDPTFEVQFLRLITM